MTMTQLNYFIAVARELNITRVAEQYHVSQPAVSAAIRDLEKEYQVTLFERRRNELILTPAGSTICKRAQKLMEHYEAFCNSLVADAGVVWTLNMALAPNIAAIHLPGLFPFLKKELPDVVLNMEEDTILNMTQNLKNGTVETALFACRESNKIPELKYLYVGALSLVLCASPDLLDLPRGKLTAKDLAGIPLVFQFRGSLLNVLVQEYFNTRDIVPNVIFHANQLNTILSFIRNGLAAGFLPPELVAGDKDIITYELEGFGVNIPIYFVYKNKTPVVSELLNQVRRYFAEKDGSAAKGRNA